MASDHTSTPPPNLDRSLPKVAPDPTHDQVRDTPAAREVASGPAPSVTAPHIEILEVHALRIDASGRVGRLRVIGVADRDDERIEVDVCVDYLDRTGVAWVAEDQQASGWRGSSIRSARRCGSRAGAVLGS